MFRAALWLRVLTLAGGLAAATAAGAAGVGAIVRGGPMADYHDDDVTQMLEAMRQALDAPGEPQPVLWRNAATGAGGTLLVLGPGQHPDFAECRRLRATLHSKKTQGTPAVWTVCKDPKDPQGRWALVGTG